MQLKAVARKFLAVLCLGMFCASAALAADRGTAAEAEAMVKKAVAFVKANGRDKAAEEFTHGSKFKDRDLYITYFELNGKYLAHGANPKLVGKDLIALKDPDGKLIVQMFVELAKTKGKGWTDAYKFRDPLTDKLAEKVFYLERIDENSAVGVGVYR